MVSESVRGGKLSTSTLRTMAILNYIATRGTPVGLSELSVSLSIPKSSVFNIVHTLVRGRYLEVDDSRLKTYRLGFRLFQTGIAYLSNVELHQIAHPYLHEMMVRLEATVHLATEDEKHLVFLDSVEAEGSLIRSAARLGRSESPMYCSGLGKALLASWPDDELFATFRGARFERRTERTVRNLSELMEEIGRTRGRGYALDTMESSEQLFCVASPLCDRTARVIAAISCSSPSHKMSDRKDEVVAVVTECAMKISQRLGFTGSRFYAEFDQPSGPWYDDRRTAITS